MGVRPPVNRHRRPRACVLARRHSLGHCVATALHAAGRFELVYFGRGRFPLCRLSRPCVRYVEIPDHLSEGADDGALADWLARRLERHRIDVVVPGDFNFTLWLAEHHERLGPARCFPVPEPELIHRLNDKGRFVELCGEIGISAADSWLVRELSDLDGIDCDGPIVAKPLAQGGGEGVHRLEGAAAVRAHVERDDRLHNGLPLLVQRYIEGVDVDVTVLAERGRLRASVVQERDPETGTYRYRGEPRALDMARRLAAAVGFHGVLDLGLRRESHTGALFPIECNPRLPASVPYKAWAGANLVELGARLCLGEPIPEHTEPPEGDCLALSVANLTAALGGSQVSQGTRRHWKARATDPLFTGANAVRQRIRP